MKIAVERKRPQLFFPQLLLVKTGNVSEETLLLFNYYNDEICSEFIKLQYKFYHIILKPLYIM